MDCTHDRKSSQIPISVQFPTFALRLRDIEAAWDPPPKRGDKSGQ
jgi:hypothetical protein